MKRTPFLTTAALVATLFAADNMASAQETVEALPPLTMSEDGSFSVDEVQFPNFIDDYDSPTTDGNCGCQGGTCNGSGCLCRKGIF